MKKKGQKSKLQDTFIFSSALAMLNTLACNRNPGRYTRETSSNTKNLSGL